MAKRINSANLIVRESIETALIELLQKKSVETVTISEIVNTANVGRVSFYRNYTCIEDVLFSAMDKLAEEWKQQINGNTKELVDQIIELFITERKLLEVIYKNNLSHLIYKLIRKYCGLDENTENAKNTYSLSILAGSIFGVCNEWARRGMQESPNEIKKIIDNLKINI